jgi:tight adherence protein B
MNLGFTLALGGLLLVIYGGVLVWYIAVRRTQTGIEDVVRAAVSHMDSPIVTPSVRHMNIVRRREETKSAYRRMEWLLGIDEYEALYYPVKQWVVILAAIGIAVMFETYIYITFQALHISFLTYETNLPFSSLFIVRRLFGMLHKRRRMKLFLQLPDALDLVTRSIRIGMPPPEALKNVGRDAPEPTATEFRKMADNMAVGMPPPQALQQMARNNKLAEYKFLAIAVSLQSSTGGSISATLENVARVIRGRVTIKQRGKAMTGEARASAALLSALPPLTVGALLVLSPAYIDKLFFTQLGLLCLGISSISVFVGRMIMRSMVVSTLDSIK